MFENNPHYLRLPANTNGRDFVVGDLHGCRSMLDDLLAHVSFDTDRDRLISVGDLVDRGPDSPGCLRLLDKPWFHAVLGNHDAMLMAWLLYAESDGKLRAYTNERMYASAFENNGGYEWALGYSDADFALPRLKRLPFVIEVEGQFRVVHAELTDAMESTTAPDDLSTEVHYIQGFDMEGDWRDHCLWGRSLHRLRRRPDHGFASVPRQPLPVFCGHTIVRKPARFCDHVFLDTGAFAELEKTGLTLGEPARDAVWTTIYKAIIERKCLGLGGKSRGMKSRSIKSNDHLK